MSDAVEFQLLASVLHKDKSTHWLQLIPEEYFSNPLARSLRNKILRNETLNVREAAFLKQQKVDYPPEVYAKTVIQDGFLREAGTYTGKLYEAVNSKKIEEVNELLLLPPKLPSLEPPLSADERFLLEGEKAVDYAYPLPDALQQLQVYWGRLLPGAIHVVAADNGVGKSLLLEQIALGLSLKDIPVVDYSIEMPFIPRMLRYYQHVHGPKLRVNEFYEKWADGSLTKEHLQEIVTPFKGKPLYIQTISNTQDMLANAEQMYYTRNAKVFLVDFLQALQGPKNMSKYESIAHAITNIFNFTKRHPSTWIVVSTYNREGKSAQRVDKQGNRQMPANQDLMGANEIETFAWTITHILRDDPTGATRRFYMSKNRFNPLGNFTLSFNGLTLTFEP